RELGDKANIAVSLDHLGEVALSGGDCARAAALFEEALALRRELGDKRGIGITQTNLAGVVYRCEDYPRAAALYADSLAHYHEVSDKSGIAACLEGMAKVACAEQRPERAGWLFGAAEALREAIGAPMSPGDARDYQRCVAAACAARGQEAFAADWAAGRAMPLEQGSVFGSNRARGPSGEAGPAAGSTSTP